MKIELEIVAATARGPTPVKISTHDYKPGQVEMTLQGQTFTLSASELRQAVETIRTAASEGAVNVTPLRRANHY